MFDDWHDDENHPYDDLQRGEPRDDAEPEFASPESVPALGGDWPALLRTFADMEDALSRLHHHLDEMRGPALRPEPPSDRYTRRRAA